MAAQLEKIERLHSQIQQSIFTIQEVLTYDELADKFIELAKAIRDYPDDTEEIWYIGSDSECSLDNLFIGAFWHYYEWHGGQYSQSYAAYCALGEVFKPGMTCGPEEGTQEQACFDLLKEMAERSQAA